MPLSILGSSLALLLLLLVAPSDAASTCPEVIAFDPAAGQSTADTGWGGMAHDRPIYGNVLRLGIDCVPGSPPCGTCAVTGLLPDAAGMFQRCLNDTSIACTEATELGDCGALDTCAVFITVPQPTAVGGVGSCHTHELTSPVTGSVDVESGALDLSVSYRSRLYIGSSPSKACPACVGDPVPNDGLRGGFCGEGPRNGLPCDGHGTSLAPYDDFGTSSFDCPSPPLALLATGEPGIVTFSTGTQSLVLSATSLGCTDLYAFGRKCFCDTCNSAAGEPCDENADCPDPAGPIDPICGGRRCIGGPNNGAACVDSSECPGTAPGGCGRRGAPTAPNACLDNTTTPEDDRFHCLDTAPIGDGKGQCDVGPVVQFCSNHPNRGCTSIADCDDVPGSCVSQNRACFVTDGTLGDVQSVSGIATPPSGDLSDPTVLGMQTCLPSTGSSLVDTIVGFPGLTRNRHVGRLTFSESGSPALACPVAPDACRTPVVTGKSQLALKDQSPDSKDQLRWRWTKGAATTLTELGDPTTTDHYDLCVYDGNGLRAGMVVPAGGLCDGRPCWKASSKGFLYKNASGTPRGITKLHLKSGDAGKSAIQVAGKGDLLPLPTLASLVAPLTLQLRHRASGLCWGATYAEPFQRRTDTDLKAKD